RMSQTAQSEIQMCNPPRPLCLSFTEPGKQGLCAMKKIHDTQHSKSPHTHTHHTHHKITTHTTHHTPHTHGCTCTGMCAHSHSHTHNLSPIPKPADSMEQRT